MRIELSPTCENRPEPDDLYGSSSWLDTLARTFDIPIRWLTADGIPLLPLAIQDDLIGRRLIALPFSDCIRSAWPWSETLRVLAVLHRMFPDFAIDIRADGALSPLPDGPGFATWEQAVYHRLPLTDPEILWHRLPDDFRWGVRKARRNGVEVRLRTDIDAIPPFYALYSDLRRRKFGILSQPIAFFHALHENFVARDRGFFLDAWHEGNCLASFLILRADDILYYKFTGSSPGHLSLKPTTLLVWTLFEKAWELGCKTIDFGMTRLDGSDSGLLDYKDRLGGERHPITRFRIASDRFGWQRERVTRRCLRKITDEFVTTTTEPNDIDRVGRALFRYFT
jgi:hypothetical protein